MGSVSRTRSGGRPESLKNTELGRQRGTEARRAKAAARAKDLAPVIEAIRAEGITSATGIAKALNDRGIPTARGTKWQAVQVQRLEQARRQPLPDPRLRVPLAPAGS
jgi:hypothetical protein